MYQNSGGQRVTVYLRKPEAGASTAFRFQRDGDLGLFYWIEDGFGCALVGKLPREQLLALAEAVYKQACSACHAVGAAGAPKSGDKAAWAPRIKKGEDALVASAIKGIGNMPPKGGNPSLTDAQIRAAVAYQIKTNR
jgi:mono/diheme cytochrome c family protein